MIGNLSHVMTLANGIIGVSVLAMPYCFKQCGIVLATLVLLVSSVMSRLASHFLIKSAVMSRRRNFEFLAFHAFGRTGKFLAELFIIGFLIGTCIAFFVVVGDLGPQIIAKMLNKQPEDIRTSIMVTTGTFIVFPLGLLRNIDSLASVCTATIGFYLCLILKVMAESTRHIFLGDWYDRVMYWRPAGILQCLPIFAMALFCQTQLFEIYEAVPNACLEKMNRIVRGALNICTIVYLFVGFFGYIAFCTQPFTGNILMSFEPSLTSDLIKIGFVLSVAFSFPLAIFPCRASLNSLLFRRAHTHEPSNYYIPEVRFRCLTLAIVVVSLGTGIAMPNIEFVLGIVGSTIGVMICLIFPAAFFIAISTKNTNERLIAQAIFFFGMWIMVVGTYANLYAMEESSTARLLLTTEKIPHRIVDLVPLNDLPKDGFPIVRQHVKDVDPTRQPYKENEERHKEFDTHDKTIDVRREPPVPVERPMITERSDVKIKNWNANSIDVPPPRSMDDLREINPVPDVSNDLKNDDAKKNIVPALEKNVDDVQTMEKSKQPPDDRNNENLIDSDAIKKEESELAAASDDANNEAAARHKKFRLTLEKHKLEQQKMLQEQKEILRKIQEEQQKRQLEMMKNRANDEKAKEARDEKLLIKNANEPSISSKNSVDREKNIATNDLIVKDKQETAKISEIPILNASSNGNESKMGRGPILNALTNRTSTIDRSREQLPVEEKFPGDVETSKNKSHRDFAVPIALQMGNQTNGLATMVKREKSIDGNPKIDVVRRDIRESVDREKRETIDDSTNEIVRKDSREETYRVIRDINGEQCEHDDEKSLISEETKRQATSLSNEDKKLMINDVKTVVSSTEKSFMDETLLPTSNYVEVGKADLANLKMNDFKDVPVGIDNNDETRSL